MHTRSLAVAIAAAVSGVFAAPALADSTTSSNWAGYAAHGTSFHSVSAEWRVPTATCTDGEATYSSMWVGLGGYSTSADALEQTGTEADCTASGTAEYSAWYELVPASSHAVSLSIEPGQLIYASVTESGGRVTLTLKDLSDGSSFRRTFTPTDLDVSSAEWIVEAPSNCATSSSCTILPLADFSDAGFSDARASTASGHRGTVTSRWWTTTRITLESSSGSAFAAYRSSTASEATPSALADGGSSFAVTYRTVTRQAGQPGAFLGGR
jgi:hypothetical protein